MEGCIAVLCTAWVLFAQITVDQRFRIPWSLMWAIALGVGFGLAALRFGHIAGKFAGGIAVVLLGGVLLSVVYFRGVVHWDTVVDYWRN